MAGRRLFDIYGYELFDSVFLLVLAVARSYYTV